MLEILILSALGLWLVLALRSCRRRGGCGGDCAHCGHCDWKNRDGKDRSGPA